MGKLELDMEHAKYPLTTRYAPYRTTGPPEEGVKHFDVTATLQIFVKEMEKYAGRLPEKLRVTIEWDDEPFEELNK